MRNLITTALDLSVDEIEPANVLIGEWCRIYGTSGSLLDYEVLPYHWDDREKAARDFNYLQD